jgi:hypothetical protein
MAVIHLYTKRKKNVETDEIGRGLTLCGHYIKMENISVLDESKVTCIKCNNIIKDDWPKYEKGYKKPHEKPDDVWPIDRSCCD